MQIGTSTSGTLVPADWLDHRKALWRPAVLAVFGTIVLTASAKAQIPFWPVPMTLQPLAVVLLGMAYGWRLGAATVALYLAQGAVGFPVFAGTPARGIGLAYMLGPTGGYLIGFLAAAIVVGWLAERGAADRLWTTLGALAAGLGAIYALGVAWLAMTLGFAAALRVGLVPFLVGDALKIAVGALLVHAVLRLRR